MKFLRSLIDFYINTSIHVAVGVFSLVQITKLSFNISTNLAIDCFIFFGTVLGYNFLKNFVVFQKKSFTFQKNHPIILVSLMSFFGMIYYYSKLEASIQVSFLKIGFLVLIYPFIRKYGFMKMFVVAFCVTYITVYIPLLRYEFKLEAIFIFLLQRFIVIVCLLIPLEIVDVTIDSKTICTLPQKIGIQNTKYWGYSLLVLSFILHLFAVNFAIDIVIVIEIFIAIITAVFIFFATENRSKYYSSFWVESIPILWFFLVFFFEDLF
jgi:hypothetical protein